MTLRLKAGEPISTAQVSVMLRKLAKWFHREDAPKTPFEDTVLGRFEVDRDVGWKKRIPLAGRDAELVLGSNDEPPPAEMLQMARSWVEAWPARHLKIIDYIRAQLRDWSDEPELPVPEKFEIESIQFL